MSAFLLKFEAIESRIASYSCPRGTSGRVHALRLRRCFQQSSRQRSIALEARLPVHDQELHSFPTSKQSKDHEKTYRQAAEGHGAATDFVNTSTLSELRQKYRHTKKYRDPYSFKSGVKKVVEMEATGDVVPLDMDNTTTVALNQSTAELYSALRAGDPHGVLEALLNQIKVAGFHEYKRSFLNSIPASTFSEILRLIDPKHFISRYSNLYKEISPADANVLGLPPLDQTGHSKFCKLFLGQIQSIMRERQRTEPLSLSDYRYLLKCARAIGDNRAADSIWSNMANAGRNPIIAPGGCVPDVECYNHYLATKCWADTLSPVYRHRLRVIPDNFEPRAWAASPYALRGHKTGPQGIKAQVSRLFREMVEEGIPGNEETFCLMLVALARENDITGLESILKRVWEIDVENLLAIDEAELPPTKSYPRDSSFYPSSRLLFAIAHAYGINNSIPKALRIIDYVSRQYSIPITFDVWTELLHWTYVLSIKRYGTRNSDGTTLGQLPQEAVGNLWDTMTSEPYNIKPSMSMYDRLIPNLLQRQRYGEAQVRMEEARQSHKRDIRALSRLILAFDSSAPGTPKRIVEERARDLSFVHLRVKISRQYIRRWVRLLIRQGSRSLVDDQTWAYQNMPKILLRWSLFLPTTLKYPTPSGEVNFRTESRCRNLDLQKRFIARNFFAARKRRALNSRW